MKLNKSFIVFVVGCLLIIGGVLVLWPKPSVQQQLKSTAAHSSAVKADPNLLFHDEFDGDTLDTSKWVACYNSYSSKYDGCTNYGNWEGEWYRPQQVSVAGGNLVLNAKKQETQGTNRAGGDQKYPYTSGMVTSGALDTTSAPKFGRTYGYYESKVFVPSGQAIWPAFWLLPVGTDWPPEIDIMEFVGSRPADLIQTYFWRKDDGGSAKDSSTYVAPSSLATNWHTYAVDWQPGSIKWYVDGRQTRQASGSNVPTQDMHMVLNLAVGGTLPGYPDATTPSEAQMLVDYVHVYKHKPAASN